MALALMEGLSFVQAAFEIASALGTVGLTMGVTPGLGFPGQLLVAGMMFLGRVGILSFSLAFLAQRRRDNKLRYPETNILVG